MCEHKLNSASPFLKQLLYKHNLTDGHREWLRRAYKAIDEENYEAAFMPLLGLIDELTGAAPYHFKPEELTVLK